jgi:cell division protein FtsW
MSGSLLRGVRLPQVAVLSHEEGSWDLRLLVPALALVMLGVAMVFSAGMPIVTQGQRNVYYYLEREAIFVVVGLFAMWAATRLSLERLRNGALVLLAVSVVLLIGVHFVGIRMNGSRSWYALPFGVRFQPSEFAKLVLVIVAARYFARFPGGLREWRQLWPPLAMLGLVCVPVVTEPDLGTVAVIGMAMLIFFHMAGARGKHLAVVAGSALALVAVKISHSHNEWERVRDWLVYLFGHTTGGVGSNYQISRSLIALGSGGVTGRGYCAGIEKYFYLPEATTDAILAVIGEELGVMATWLVVALFAYLVWRGLWVARHAEDRFSGLLAAGITCLFGVQALVNIAVITGVIPTTGVTLPFVSYGGSSLLLSLVGIGLLLNVSRQMMLARAPRSTP